MNSLEPLVTVHSGTDAYRAVTSDLLAEAYLAPRSQSAELGAILSDQSFPWSGSMDVAPIETVKAVAAALRSMALATEDLDPDAIDLSSLDPDSRICRQLAALVDLWRQTPSALPEDLQICAHVLSCSASDALEPLALVTPRPCSFAAPLERRLHTHLLDHHGMASKILQRKWAARRDPLRIGAPEGTSLWRAQQGLTGAAIPSGPLDETLAIFSVRDGAEEADFAAARSQRLIDDGVAPSEIGLLVPDEAGYSHWGSLGGQSHSGTINSRELDHGQGRLYSP